MHEQLLHITRPHHVIVVESRYDDSHGLCNCCPPVRLSCCSCRAACFERCQHDVDVHLGNAWRETPHVDGQGSIQLQTEEIQTVSRACWACPFETCHICGSHACFMTSGFLAGGLSRQAETQLSENSIVLLRCSRTGQNNLVAHLEAMQALKGCFVSGHESDSLLCRFCTLQSWLTKPSKQKLTR